MKIRIAIVATISIGLMSLPPFGLAEIDNAYYEDSESNTCASIQHVEFVARNTPRVSEKVHEDWRNSLQEPGDNQKDIAKMALKALPRFVCKAVRYIGFVSIPHPEGGIAFVDKRFPATILVVATEGLASEGNLGTARQFNEDDFWKMVLDQLSVWPLVVKSIIHEAVHCATFLLESVNDEPWSIEFAYPDVFTDDAVADAKRIVKKNQLKLDLANDWERVHLQLFDSGLAQDYYRREFLEKQFRDGKPPGEVSKFLQKNLGIDLETVVETYREIRELPEEDVDNEPPDGFMSIYASKDATEDIAESAAWPIFMRMYEVEKTIRIGNMPNLELGTYSDFGTDEEKEARKHLVPSWKYKNACSEKLAKTSNDHIPSKLTAIYLKLNYLLDLELISKEAFDACIGQGKIRLKRVGESQPGFESFVLPNRRHTRKYSDKLQFKRELGWSRLSAEGKVTWVKELDAKIVISINSRSSREGMPKGRFKIDKPCIFTPLFASQFDEAKFEIVTSGSDIPFMTACDAMVFVLRSTTHHIEGFAVIRAYFKRLVPERPKHHTIVTFVVDH